VPRGERVEGYPRRHRFTTRGSFGPVLKDGRKVRGRLAVLHVLESPGGISRLGIALTRKLVAAASHRNRVKRGIRELYRRHELKASGLDLVVTLRERVVDESIPTVVAEVAALLDQVRPGSGSAPRR
jgi:ribonuclease P protein component